MAQGAAVAILTVLLVGLLAVVSILAGQLRQLREEIRGDMRKLETQLAYDEKTIGMLGDGLREQERVTKDMWDNHLEFRNRHVTPAS